MRHVTSFRRVLATVSALLLVLVATTVAVVAPGSTSTATPASAWGALAPITLGSNPTVIAAGGSGNIWVADSTDSTVTQITTVGGVSTVQTPIALTSGSNPTGITVDLDGNVWVGNTNTGTVQEIRNVSGTWTPQSPLAVGRSGYTMELATAPDGSVWVIFVGSQNVQRVAKVNGVWTVESMLTSDSSPVQIAFDSNGTGWLTNTSNFITELVETNGVWGLAASTPTPYWARWGTNGRNGSLYLSDSGCRVYEFLPATQTMPYQGFPDCDSDAIAATADGSIWLTSRGRGTVDRWSSTDFSLQQRFPITGRPVDLTVASDGSLWFVNLTNHNVQRMVFDTPVASTITSANSTSMTMGQQSTFTVTTTGGFPTPVFRTTDPLPFGVTLVDNGNGTATIGGAPRPGSEGVYSVTLDALNGSIVTTQTLTLTVPGTPPQSLPVFYDGEAGGWATCSVNSIAPSPSANVWVGSNDGRVLRYTTGTLALADTFTPANSGTTVDVTTASDGTVWFIDTTNHVVYSISQSNGVWSLDTPLTVGSNPRFLTAGADGSVWVADPTDATVTPIANNGGVRTVGTPIAFSGTDLSGMTTGADGSIWVGDRNAGAVLRISESNNVWSAGSPISLVMANHDLILSTGPDGQIWIVFRGSSTIQTVANVSGTWTALTSISTPEEVFSISPGPNSTLFIGFGGTTSQMIKENGVWQRLGQVPARFRPTFSILTDNGSMWWSDSGCALFEWKSVIGVAPTITSPSSGSMTIDSWSSINITATGAPNVAIALVGTLPSGVYFSSDQSQSRATISGQPSNTNTPGDYTVKLIGSNGAYRDTVQTFTLSIVDTSSTTSSTEAPTSSTTQAPTSSTTEAPTSSTTDAPTSSSSSTTQAPTSSTSSTIVAAPVLSESQITQLPAATLTPIPPRRGAKVRIRARGFRARERVQIMVASDPILLGEVDADDNGEIDTEVDIPSDLAPGDHHLASFGLTSGYGVSQAFTIESSDGSALPATGTESRAPLVAGLGLVVAGAGLAFAARTTNRRRRNTGSW